MLRWNFLMAWLVWSHPGSLRNPSPNTVLERRDLLAFAYQALGLKEFISAQSQFVWNWKTGKTKVWSQSRDREAFGGAGWEAIGRRPTDPQWGCTMYWIYRRADLAELTKLCSGEVDSSLCPTQQCFCCTGESSTQEAEVGRAGVYGQLGKMLGIY